MCLIALVCVPRERQKTILLVSCCGESHALPPYLLPLPSSFPPSLSLPTSLPPPFPPSLSLPPIFSFSYSCPILLLQVVPPHYIQIDESDPTDDTVCIRSFKDGRLWVCSSYTFLCLSHNYIRVPSVMQLRTPIFMSSLQARSLFSVCLKVTYSPSTCVNQVSLLPRPHNNSLFFLLIFALCLSQPLSVLYSLSWHMEHTSNAQMLKF